MSKPSVVDRRPLFRVLPNVDAMFFLALGIIGIAACLAIGLR